jgi:hypothetical protein
MHVFALHSFQILTVKKPCKYYQMEILFLEQQMGTISGGSACSYGGAQYTG